MSAKDKEIKSVVLGEVYLTITYDDDTTLRVQTKDVAEVYFSQNHRPTTLFPPVMRYISSDMKGFLLERPPSIASVTVSDGKANDMKLQLPLPWHLYAVQVRNDTEADICMFFRNSQIYSSGDPFFCSAHPAVNFKTNVIPGKFDVQNNLKEFMRMLTGHPGTVVVVDDAYDVDGFMARLPEKFRVTQGTPYEMVSGTLKNWSMVSDVTDEEFLRATDGETHITSQYWIDKFVADMSVGSTAATIDRTNVLTFFESLARAAETKPQENKKAKVADGV